MILPSRTWDEEHVDFLLNRYESVMLFHSCRWELYERARDNKKPNSSGGIFNCELQIYNINIMETWDLFWSRPPTRPPMVRILRGVWGDPSH